MRKGGKSHMELDDLLKLIDHVSKSKLDDFCYETGEIKLRLKKNAAKEIVVQQKEVKKRSVRICHCSKLRRCCGCRYLKKIR